jgi:hypothetical protein
MKSYEQDQKQFIRALKEILGDGYWLAVVEARKAKEEVLKGINEPSPRDLNAATAAGNRVMARAAKLAGVLSVPQYIKDQKEAFKQEKIKREESRRQHRKAADQVSNVKAHPGNFTSNKVPLNQGYSLNAEMEKTFKQARTA